MGRIYRHVADGVETAWPLALPDGADHLVLLMSAPPAPSGALLTVLVGDPAAVQTLGVFTDVGTLQRLEINFAAAETARGSFEKWTDDGGSDSANVLWSPLTSLNLECHDLAAGDAPAPLPAGTLIEWWKL